MTPKAMFCAEETTWRIRKRDAAACAGFLKSSGLIAAESTLSG